MAEQYFYVRCWPGFTDRFPFDRFNLLPDDQIGIALDAYAAGWERRNKGKIETRRRRELDEWIARLRQQSARRIGSGDQLSRRPPTRKFYHWALAPDGDYPPPGFRPPVRDQGRLLRGLGNEVVARRLRRCGRWPAVVACQGAG